MSGQNLKFDDVWSGQRRYSSRSLHGQVVHEMGKRIASGTLKEGEVIPNEADLCTEFEVSRTALREGIKVLAAKGLLASRTRTGTRVRPRNEWNMLDPDVLAWRLESATPDVFVQDLYEIRCAIEPVAASLAAVRAPDQSIAAMEQALDEMESAGPDFTASVEPDLRFHQEMLEASGNQILGSLGHVIETSLVFSARIRSPEKSVESMTLHRSVLGAIRDRDGVAASEAMLKLLEYARDWNREVLNGVFDRAPDLAPAE